MKRVIGRGVVLPLLLLLLPWMGSVQAEDEYLIYPFQSGDTLIGIGQRILVEPEGWRTLQQINAIRDPYRIPVGTPLRIPLRLLEGEPREAVVAAVSGAALVDGAPVEPGALLMAGATLVTGEDGSAILRLSDGSELLVPPETELRLDRLHSYRQIDGLDVG